MGIKPRTLYVLGKRAVPLSYIPNLQNKYLILRKQKDVLEGSLTRYIILALLKIRNSIYKVHL
jgi:hypothetical protein